jgi:anti-sigma B factor antagonist
MTNADETGAAETRHGTASVSISGSPTQVVHIGGDVDLANASDIDHRVSSAFRPDVDHVVVDLGETTYLDSAGLAMLVRISSRLQAARTAMSVVAPPESVAHRVIALSGLVSELALRSE